MSTDDDKDPLLGTVVVVGGCGFLGWTFVGHLLNEADCGAVHVVDRATMRNRHPGAEYHTASITDAVTMASLLQVVQPRTVFHLASPNFTVRVAGRSDFTRTNVDGTRTLLDLCCAAGSVRAFVYASSVQVYADPPHEDLAEDAPTWTDARHEPYSRTKALADALVLAANGPSLRTASIRVGLLYGPRDRQQLSLLVDVCAGWRPLFQLGPGTNLMAVVSTDNTSKILALAAKALLDPSRAEGKVDGEAFNATDGQPMAFWHHLAQFWSAARGRDVRPEMHVIPAWVVRIIFFVVAWLYWLLTLGMVDPPTALSATTLVNALETHTYSVEKARKRLGYRPVLDTENVVRQAVEEELMMRKLADGTKKEA